MATIVTRSGKGSALTHTEMDANFTNLNTELASAGGFSWTSAQTSYTTVTGLSGARELVIVFDGLTQSTSNGSINIQLGDSGGVEGSGYIYYRQYYYGTQEYQFGSEFTTLSGIGYWPVGYTLGGSNYPCYAQVYATSPNGTDWHMQGQSGSANNNASQYRRVVISGHKTLSAALDRVSISASGSYGAGSWRVGYR